MSRRKNRPAIELILSASWRTNASLAAFVLIITFAIIPAIALTNPILTAMSLAVRPLGLLVASALLLVAVINYFRKRAGAYRSSRLGIRHEAVAPEVPRSFGWGRDKVADAWEASIIKPEAEDATRIEWTLELLRAIEWKRFEELCAAYFREKTFKTEMQPAGADGGVDITLFARGSSTPFAIVQCKAWNARLVDVKPIRELLGVMAHRKIAKGIFVTTGDYTRDAYAFAKQNPLSLITGEMLMKGILSLPDEGRQRLLAVATEGDYLTPTCASCGIKMVPRTGSKGSFWGCRNYPRCKTKIYMRAAPQV